MEIDEKYIRDYKLIVTIIKKGLASNLTASLKKVGISGNTIFFGKGAAEESVYEKILNIEYEPEKEIILIALHKDTVDDALNTIIKKTQLNKPGNGIAFVLDLNKCVGIARILNMEV